MIVFKSTNVHIALYVSLFFLIHVTWSQCELYSTSQLMAAPQLQLILSLKGLLEGAENQYGKAWKTRPVNVIGVGEIP